MITNNQQVVETKTKSLSDRYWSHAFKKWITRKSLKLLVIMLSLPYLLLLGIYALLALLNSDSLHPLTYYPYIQIQLNDLYTIIEVPFQIIWLVMTNQQALSWPAPLDDYFTFPVIMLPFFLLSLGCFVAALKFIPFNSNNPFTSAYLMNFLSRAKYNYDKLKRAKKELIADSTSIQGNSSIRALLGVLGCGIHFCGYFLFYSTLTYTFIPNVYQNAFLSSGKSEDILLLVIWIGFWLGSYPFYFLFFVFPIIGIPITIRYGRLLGSVSFFLGFILFFPALLLTALLLVIILPLISIIASILTFFVTTFFWTDAAHITGPSPIKGSFDAFGAIMWGLVLTIFVAQLLGMFLPGYIGAVNLASNAFEKYFSSSSSQHDEKDDKSKKNERQTIRYKDVHEVEKEWKMTMLYEDLYKIISRHSISEPEARKRVEKLAFTSENHVLNHFGYESLLEFLIALENASLKKKQLRFKKWRRIMRMRDGRTKKTRSLLLIDEQLWRNVIELSSTLKIKDLATTMVMAMTMLPKDNPLNTDPLAILKMLNHYEKNLKTLLQLHIHHRRIPSIVEGFIDGNINIIEIPIIIELAILPFEQFIDWERMRPNLIKEVKLWHETTRKVLGDDRQQDFTLQNIVLKVNLSYFQAKVVLAYNKRLSQSG